jgi:hypothetical protein
MGYHQEDIPQGTPNNRNRKMMDEMAAIIVSLLFLIIGILMIWVVRKSMDMQGEAVFIALLLIPIVIYAVITGRIGSIKAGGLEANFVDEPVGTVFDIVGTSIMDIQLVQKVGPVSMKTLEEMQRQLREDQTIVMTIGFGNQHYTRQDAYDYLKALSHFRNFKFVVFLDQASRFVAYMPSWAVTSLLNQPELGEEFIKVINEGRTSDLWRFPGVIRDTIRVQDTSAAALREMMQRNLEALVVIDENKQLKGVVVLTQVLSRMMLKLAR